MPKDLKLVRGRAAFEMRQAGSSIRVCCTWASHPPLGCESHGYVVCVLVNLVTSLISFSRFVVVLECIKQMPSAKI